MICHYVNTMYFQFCMISLVCCWKSRLEAVNIIYFENQKKKKNPLNSFMHYVHKFSCEFIESCQSLTFFLCHLHRSCFKFFTQMSSISISIYVKFVFFFSTKICKLIQRWTWTTGFKDVNFYNCCLFVYKCFIYLFVLLTCQAILLLK